MIITQDQIDQAHAEAGWHGNKLTPDDIKTIEDFILSPDFAGYSQYGEVFVLRSYSRKTRLGTLLPYDGPDLTIPGLQFLSSDARKLFCPRAGRTR